MKRSSFARKTSMRRGPRDQPAEVAEPVPATVRRAPALTRRAVMAPSNDAVFAQPKEEVTAKPGKHAPTAAEREWMDAIVAYGCVACRIDGHAPRPTAVHHILRGGQRIGHLFTLSLCDPGHHQGGEQFGLISRHPYKARFEAKYGTELELLARLRATIQGATNENS